MSPIPTTTIPREQTAVVAQGPGELAIQHDAPVPILTPDTAIVRTKAVAINPADAKMLDYSAAAGAVHGYDFAGVIVSLGQDAPEHLTVGDRVAGLVHGMNVLQPDVGAFAEYVAAPADLLLKLPDHVTFEEGATLATGLATAGLALLRDLQIPASLEQPRTERSSSRADFVLVSGGSTATGTRAIQLVSSIGLRPIATCSEANFALARQFGAEQVFDYHSPTCAADIRAYTQNALAYALDCVSVAETTQLCYAAIGRAGGRYVALEPYRESITTTRPTIEPSWLMVLTIFGRPVALDGDYGREARPEDRQFGAGLFAAAQRLLDRGMMRPHPVKHMTGGWQGVIDGVDIVRRQAVSGQKLVYSV